MPSKLEPRLMDHTTAYRDVPVLLGELLVHRPTSIAKSVELPSVGSSSEIFETN